MDGGESHASLIGSITSFGLCRTFVSTVPGGVTGNNNTPAAVTTPKSRAFAREAIETTAPHTVNDEPIDLEAESIDSEEEEQHNEITSNEAEQE
jgi:hypothetical protein